MAIIEVKCPKCGSTHVIKHGRTSTGTQRYLCKDCKDSFLLEYTYNAYKSGTEETIIKMTANDCAELDEIWSFVQNKSNQRWLCLAINHDTGDILAYTFGKRKDKVFREFKSILEPFGISILYR